MSKSPVVIEVTRGPLVESRHEGIAAVVKADGTVVESWGDIDARILPRSANKPIQAMAFVESGAVEKWGLGNEHVSLSCASHNGEKRHVETVRAWLKKVGLSETDLECGTHAPRLQTSIEALVRENALPTAAFNNCSGKHSGFLTTAVTYGEPTAGYIKYDHPVQRRLREVMSDLCGENADNYAHGVDGCGIPTLATPLRSLARAMASMADPSNLSSKRADAARRIQTAINAEPFMMAGTGRFCTRINELLPGKAQIKTGAEGVFCAMLPTLKLGIALKMWDGAGRAAEIAMATLLGHLGVLPAAKREELLHPPVKNVVGLLVGEMRPAQELARLSTTLNIVEVGARGDGLAEEAGQRWFVPFTLPGEVVEAEPREERGGGTVADLVEVLAPSRHRVKAPCRHFGTCGNCALQHWRLDAYGAWKIDLIARALSQQGVEAPAFEPMVQGVPGERRRADFIVRRGLAGFHERGSHRAFNVEECHVLRPALLALLPVLRTILPGDAAADAIVNETDSGFDVLVRPHKRLKLSMEANQKLVTAAHAAGLARLSWGDRANPDPIAALRTPRLAFGDVTVDPPPGVFLQATKRAEQAMRAAVAGWLPGAKKVADLFAGVGALTLGQPFRATLYESDKPAADAIAKRGGVRRDLFRNPLLAADLKSFDAVVLDPPRAGAAAQVAELGQSRIGRIVYASCDPGTFARDAKVLQEAGYRLEKLMPIDQFLWSVHVELIALFSKS